MYDSVLLNPLDIQLSQQRSTAPLELTHPLPAQAEGTTSPNSQKQVRVPNTERTTMTEQTARAAVAKWNEAIDDKVGAGKTREQAIAELVYSDLHAAYLEGWSFLNDSRKF